MRKTTRKPDRKRAKKTEDEVLAPIAEGEANILFNGTMDDYDIVPRKHTQGRVYRTISIDPDQKTIDALVKGEYINSKYHHIVSWKQALKTGKEILPVFGENFNPRIFNTEECTLVRDSRVKSYDELLKAIKTKKHRYLVDDKTSTQLCSDVKDQDLWAVSHNHRIA